MNIDEIQVGMRVRTEFVRCVQVAGKKECDRENSDAGQIINLPAVVETAVVTRVSPHMVYCKTDEGVDRVLFPDQVSRA